MAMKKLRPEIPISLALFFIAFCSCSVGDKQMVNRLYRDKEFLLKEFKDVTIFRRNESFVQLSYYKGQLVNTFFFEIQDSSFALVKDTLQFSIKEITSLATWDNANKKEYSNTLIDELKRLMNEMNRYGITNVSAEFASAGIDMKIYFGEDKALLYVSDVTNLKNGRWKNYIGASEKFDSNWYYAKEER